MKKYIEGPLSPFFLFFLLVNLLSCTSETNFKYDNPKWEYEQLSQAVQPGDIILKLGYGKISRSITKFLKEPIPFSHCAVVSSKTTLIHTISGKLVVKDGVQEIELKEFMKDVVPGSLYLLRHKSNLNQRKRIAEYAQIQLNKNVPFDEEFIHTDSTKLYCSEIVANALIHVYGKPYLNVLRIGENNIYGFNGLVESPDFEVVLP